MTWVFIFLFALSLIFIYSSKRKSGKNSFPFRIPENLQKEYKLLNSDKKYIESNISYYKYGHSQFIHNEIIKLYIETYLELKNQNFSKTLKDSAFNVCKYVALRKLGFIDEVLEKTSYNKKVIDIVNSKIDCVSSFSKNEEKAAFRYINDLWKNRYLWLTESFTPSNIKEFYEQICKLSEMNGKYSEISRKLFHQSHQFLAKHNAGYSLLCYLHYVDVKFGTKAQNFMAINKDDKALIFQNKNHEKSFTEILNRFKTDKNLDKALESTKLQFNIERREIKLDIAKIEEAGREHAQVADLLGQYLEDETTVLEEKNEIKNPEQSTLNTISDNETELFHLFKKQEFVLNIKEIDNFAIEKGVFRDSFIQQINEKYYDTFDDLIIEEDSGTYTLNRQYYEQIVNNANY